VKLADLYIQDLRRIGVEMTPEFIEVASLVERLRERDYESYVAVLEVTNDPDEWSVYWETGGYENGYDWGAYSNARVDELFGLARRELDRSIRARYYAEIQQILYDEQPFTIILGLPLAVGVLQPYAWRELRRRRSVSVLPRHRRLVDGEGADAVAGG
jgi:peptide/nickel transport system substrate-binding protein